MVKSIKELEYIIKYNFKNKELLHTALTHKSYDNDKNNEKLEFLGDRVLGLVISKELLERYPLEKEGSIDKKFANLVNKKTCVSLANKLNLKKDEDVISNKEIEISNQKNILSKDEIKKKVSNLNELIKKYQIKRKKNNAKII